MSSVVPIWVPYLPASSPSVDGRSVRPRFSPRSSLLFPKTSTGLDWVRSKVVTDRHTETRSRTGKDSEEFINALRHPDLREWDSRVY